MKIKLFITVMFMAACLEFAEAAPINTGLANVAAIATLQLPPPPPPPGAPRLRRPRRPYVRHRRVVRHRSRIHIKLPPPPPAPPHP